MVSWSGSGDLNPGRSPGKGNGSFLYSRLSYTVKNCDLHMCPKEYVAPLCHRAHSKVSGLTEPIHISSTHPTGTTNYLLHHCGVMDVGVGVNHCSLLDCVSDGGPEETCRDRSLRYTCQGKMPRHNHAQIRRSN